MAIYCLCYQDMKNYESSVIEAVLSDHYIWSHLSEALSSHAAFRLLSTISTQN